MFTGKHSDILQGALEANARHNAQARSDREEVTVRGIIARVEIKDSVEADYDALDSAMAAIGFRNTVGGTGGTTKRRLPQGEYVNSNMFDMNQAFEAVSEAAESLEKYARIVVIEMTNFSWGGLDEAE